MTGRALAVGLLIVVGCTTQTSDEPTTTEETRSTSTRPAAPSSTISEGSESTSTTFGMTLPDNPTLTPSQQEGPFYPVEKPTDRDNDLTVVEGQSTVAAGQMMLIRGLLVDLDGQPVVGATVEIWQTDHNGVYLHPGDAGFDSRDNSFQGYGEAVTDANGVWSFRTIDPGKYEPRPRHIHLKVFVDGEEVLTSQIYFADDPDAEGIDPALVANVTLDDDGSSLIGEHLLVVDV